MFVEERGGELWLGAAIPRSWLTEGRRVGIEDARTYYGPCSATWQSRVDEGRIAMTLEPPVRNAPERIRVRFRHPGSRRMTRCEVNGAAYPNFDADKEWVTLTNCQAITEVVAYYD
ncbi:MAG: hypothetical protein QG656_481 [Candidatus Hydrogenedentes bacterium]|nr:hypothetical protein [Candidatus Hydrogenedentota bacterium]